MLNLGRCACCSGWEIQPGTDDQVAFDQLIGKIDERFGEGFVTPNHVLTVPERSARAPPQSPQEAYADTEPYPEASTSDPSNDIKPCSGASASALPARGPPLSGSGQPVPSCRL